MRTIGGARVLRCRQRTVGRFVLAVLGFWGLAGCADRGVSHGMQAEVWDSAGIRVVHHRVIPINLPVWAVSEQPEVVIGSMEGDRPDVFGSIQSLAVRSDGVIVVADGKSYELRAFDSSGNHLWSAGRRGQGPGEFSSISSLHALQGDSVVVLDVGRRANIFDPDGQFVRQYRLDPPPTGFPGGPEVVGAMSSGGLMGYALPMPPMETGYFRVVLAPVYYDRRGTLRAVGDELLYGEGVAFLNSGLRFSTSLRMRRGAQFAVGRERVAITTQERFEIALYDSVGTPEQIIRIGTDPSVVDASVRRRYAAFCSAVVESKNCGIPQQVDLNEILPGSLPAVGGIRYDVQGHLWVEEYVPPYEGRVPVWWAIGRDGDFHAQVSVPSGLSVHYVGPDFVVGTTRDEFDVPYVQVHRLVRR